MRDSICPVRLQRLTVPTEPVSKPRTEIGARDNATDDSEKAIVEVGADNHPYNDGKKTNEFRGVVAKTRRAFFSTRRCRMPPNRRQMLERHR